MRSQEPGSRHGELIECEAVLAFQGWCLPLFWVSARMSPPPGGLPRLLCQSQDHCFTSDDAILFSLHGIYNNLPSLGTCLLPVSHLDSKLHEG